MLTRRVKMVKSSQTPNWQTALALITPSVTRLSYPPPPPTPPLPLPAPTHFAISFALSCIPSQKPIDDKEAFFILSENILLWVVVAGFFLVGELRFSLHSPQVLGNKNEVLGCHCLKTKTNPLYCYSGSLWEW